MSLNEKDRELVDVEERCLSETLGSISKQKKESTSKLSRERERARILTAEMVNAQQVEDKQLIASDEAVAHALSSKKADDVQMLDELEDSPYFARFILEEEHNGRPITREYKLGKYANPDCRIIDWRKAPMAKIYYEYKEGDEFFEEVQGRDREGTVLLRNAVDISEGLLRSLQCSEGNFKKVDGSWQRVEGGRSQSGGQGKLPDVLSLITADQFNMITQDAETAILLQGVAGSGKTTVALHRLSWLVGQGRSDCQAQNIAIVAESPMLRAYIKNSLEHLDLKAVKVTSFEELAKPFIQKLDSTLCYEDGVVRRPRRECPQSVKRLLSSMAFLEQLEKTFETFKANISPFTLVLKTLADETGIIENDDTRLINKSLIQETKEIIEQYAENTCIDVALDPLMLRIYQLHNKQNKPSFDHLLIDEVQEASPLKLATFLDAVDSPARLTLVGDTAQAFQNEQSFPGWDALKKRWSATEADTQYISLRISHRSTLPIMKLADFVQERKVVTEGRQGRVPIHFKQLNEESAVGAAIDWLKKAMELYPHQVTAVLCATRQEATQLESLLRPTFGGQVRIETSGEFSFDAGIIVTTIPNVRGLEFTNVLVWNVNSIHYPKHPRARNALYVAITRAEENLCLISWGRTSQLLPGRNSKLTRCIVEEVEE